MLAIPPLIVVSNRLPVSVKKSGGKLVFEASTGGLATAMSSLDNSGSNIWIGWPGISSDELTADDKKTIRKELEKNHCYPVFLNSQQIERFYDGYANATLWPLFHYFQSLTEHHTEQWREYQKVNKLFAAAVMKYATADSQIWIHDYHLMILPKLLRDELPESSIGFFLHIPFPSYEIYRLLPDRKEIIEGLLGADLVGFHTYDYVRHFLSAALRTLGHDSNMSAITVGDRLVRADVFPIGIDYDKFAGFSKSPEVKAELTALKNRYDDQKIVLSVDRLDYSKGILERLEAFDHFLETNKRWLKKITLVVVAVPSRIAIDAYQHMREDIERAVSRINGRYSTVDWSPISYQYKNLPFVQLVALYARADVALVTPLRDGMNLVAKEYIASKQSRPGVLIISEMAGVADELPEAIRVNPKYREDMARALETALRMPIATQRRKLATMQHRLALYDVGRWAQDFIEQLSTAKNRRVAHDLKLVDDITTREIIAKYRQAKRRLLMLDYDGTLTNFVNDIRPMSSRPSGRLLKMLKKLGSTPGNEVVIVSGRPKRALDSWFSKLPLDLVAEHGAWVKDDGKWSARSSIPAGWKEPIRTILEAITERTPGSLIEEKNFSLVWHYRNVSPELAYVRKASLRHDTERLLHDSDVEVFQGNKILEFKPSFITKGAAAKEKLAGAAYDFVLAIGDDYTDEDLFETLPVGSFTIKVGLSNSSARYHVTSVEEVHRFLAHLAAAVD
ncbi:MAG TPA: bifunctional alpha,alpha-trehalose-phosphate synthase (UDP-forming)/trehalose-phosphatase [Candidatus Saccharimonadia bacterium]|nr:bifunctional alpha,alpha-trehalose-phosphate synthase (UDP-forming)/trehalose-phosphatase [Candidatus Saccharimonadia bacterium]